VSERVEHQQSDGTIPSRGPEALRRRNRRFTLAQLGVKPGPDSRTSIRTDLATPDLTYLRTSFLYVTRCGVSASAPFLRRRSADSLKFPSNHMPCVLLMLGTVVTPRHC
jgi:hypothetical protein